ncbi:MAG: DUF4367 domain-containing protein [Clostridia bacterium]|nr:DUF4367 domain-containing protein [Clostridia bacterium]
MRAIISGKTPRKPLSTKMIAILVAAAILLLAGCAIIYRDEIREFITNIKEFFVEVKFDEGENDSQNIDEIYELTYLPEGYGLKEEYITRMRVEYVFANSSNESIRFIQQPLDSATFSVDSEHSDTILIEIEEYTVYYRIAGNMHYYLWNDGKYALKINSALELSDNELLLITNGLKVKQ